MIRTLPGLIDPHVHLRDPGQTEKEDFYSGTCAALAGGYTTILDMPNNKAPITTLERLNEKIEIARKKIVCDVGFYFGSVGDNLAEFPKVAKKATGLKLYLSQTTGGYVLDPEKLERVFLAWPKEKLILVHAEGKMVEKVLKVVEEIRRPVHFCHVGLAWELVKIRAAKEKGWPITCGVTPHHLFLTERDVKSLGPFAKMRPPLGSRRDQDFLWQNLQVIDVVESDHAPHTIEEKEGENPPFGVPGMETTLPLLLTAVNQNQLTIDDIVRLCFENPVKIFGVKRDQNTKVEIDPRKSYIINHKSLFTKCGWSPFNGWKVKGKVRRVFLRGKKVFENGTILATPGSGKVL